MIGKPGSSAATSLALPSSSQQRDDLVTVFEMRAPRWRPRLHPGSQTLGEPDIYVRNDETGAAVAPEDEMSEANIRNGLNTRAAVGNETFSAHDMIYDRLKGKAVVQSLSSLFDEVMQRRAQLAALRSGPAPSQYRHPQRVTLNEVKLAAYVKELADPNVPLRKLARSVPHGYRGERMLDMLWNGGSLASALAAVKSKPSMGSVASSPSMGAGPNVAGGSQSSVAIDRAVWFVRVVGASEINSSRLRQGNSAAYTAEWTGVLMAWLRRQIVELNIVHHHQANMTGSPVPSSPLPSRSRPSVSLPSPLAMTPQRSEEPYALILEDDFCQRWTAKWEYSLSLLQALMYEHLIDGQVAARAAIDMLRTANVVQVFIALSLVEQFWTVIVQSATLTYFVVDVLNTKITDTHSNGVVGSSHATLIRELRAMLTFCIAHAPDAMLAPSSWRRMTEDRTLVEELRKGANGNNLDGITHRVASMQTAYLSMLMHDSRDEHFISGQLRIVKVLDGFARRLSLTDTFDAIFFSDDGKPVKVRDKIRLMLTWATTQWRSGFYRTYLVASLLQMYVERQSLRRKRRNESGNGVHARPVDLERLDIDALITAWITEVDSAQQTLPSEGERNIRYLSPIAADSVDALTSLLGELSRLQCFSFQKYLRRLTARGLTVMGGREERSDAHIGSVVESGDERGQQTPEESGITTGDSIHSKLLRNIPLFSASSALEHQRRIAIYGNRTKESYEEAVLRRAWREVYTQMLWLFAPMEADTIKEGPAGRLEVPRFSSSSRYVRNRIITSHVQPMVRQYVEHHAVTVEQFKQVVSLYTHADDHSAMADFMRSCMLHLGKDKAQRDVHLTSAVETVLQQYLLIWRAMGINLPVAAESISSEESLTAVDPARREGAIEVLREALKLFLEDSLDTSMASCTQWKFDEVLTIDLLSEQPTESYDELANCIQALMKAGSLVRTAFSAAFIQRLPSSPVIRGLLFPLWQRGTITLDAILGDVIIGAAPDSTTGIQIPEKRSLDWLLPFLESINGGDTDDRLDKRYSDLQSPMTLGSLVHLLCWLSRAVELWPEEEQRLQDVRRRLAGLMEVRLYVQENMASCVEAIRLNGTPQAFHAIMSELLPLTWNWKSDGDIVAATSDLCSELNSLQWDQSMSELSVAIEATQSGADLGPSQRKSHTDALALLISEEVLSRISGADAKSCLEGLLTARRAGAMSSAAIANALIEVHVQSLNKCMEATFVDEERLRTRAMSATQLLQTVQETGANVSMAVVQCLRLTTEWFEGRLEGAGEANAVTPAAEGSLSMSEVSKAGRGSYYIRLSIVCSLLRLNGLLGAQTTKPLAPRLFAALAQNALMLERVAKDDGEDEEQASKMVSNILDVLAYLLQQAPAEVQQSMQSRATEQISSLINARHDSSAATTVRLAWLINLDNDRIRAERARLQPCHSLSSLHKSYTLVEGQSSTSALADGLFNLVAIKAWERHPTVEMLTGPGIGSSEGTPANAIASKTEISTLTNNGPLSLHHFAAHRTMDRLPNLSVSLSASRPSTGSDGGPPLTNGDSVPPAALISEQSYGLHHAGQPTYARDAQRGLLALSPWESAANQAKHLVPALQPVGGGSSQATPRVDDGEVKAKNAIGSANTSEEVSQASSSSARRKRKTATGVVEEPNVKEGRTGAGERGRKRTKK